MVEGLSAARRAGAGDREHIRRAHTGGHFRRRPCCEIDGSTASGGIERRFVGDPLGNIRLRTLFALNLFLEFQRSVQQRALPAGGRAARHVPIHRTRFDRPPCTTRSCCSDCGGGAGTIEDPLARLRHLIVDPADHGAILRSDRAAMMHARFRLARRARNRRRRTGRDRNGTTHWRSSRSRSRQAKVIGQRADFAAQFTTRRPRSS